MKKTRFTRLICSLIVCTLVLSVPVSSTTVKPVEVGSKISDELQEVMNNSNDTDLIDIYISIKTLDIDELKETLNNKYKFDYDIYQNTNACREMLVTKVLSELKTCTLYKEWFKDINYEDYKSMSFSKSSIESTKLEKINEYLNQKIDYYRQAKLEVYKTHYNSARDYIKNKYNNDSYKELLRFGIISLTKAKATKEVIYNLEQEPMIESIDLYKKVIVKSNTSVASTQIGADSSTGTKSIMYSPKYNGNNVKIGVIESDGRFDPSCKQLTSAFSAGRLVYVPIDIAIQPINEHATLVVSEILGSAASVTAPDNRIHRFEGIVPSSNVYFTTFNGDTQLYAAIEKLVDDYSVSVINLSASISYAEEDGITPIHTGDYEIFDKTVDQLVREYGITFIVAAGNEGRKSLDYITCPGKALNVVTVGALTSKNSIFPTREELATTQFPVADYSSTYNSDKLPQKPDISAPGSYISGVVNDNGNLLYEDEDNVCMSGDSGTSFAAPLVTGVAAQIIQADPILKNHGLAVKAVILGGANKNSVDTNYFIEDYISREAGVGMVNSIDSVDRAESQTSFNGFFSITPSGASSTTSNTNVTLTSGKTVRIVMTYNKIYDTLDMTNGYPNQLKIQLYSGNTLVADSIYSHNNVKIIEYTVPTTGTYTIRISMKSGYKKPTSGTVYQEYAVSYGYN